MTTLSVGSPASGTIEAAGERHRYDVELTAGALLYADGRGACGADLRYQLYSPSGVLMFGFDRPVCQDAGRAQVTESGRHELRVDGLQRATGPYDILLSAVRPNGGGVLEPGAVAAGTIDQPGAEDVWTFEGDLGDAISLQPQVECGAELRYEVRSASGALPLGIDFRVCDPGFFIVNEAGPYTLRFYGRELATGPYGLALIVTPG